MKLVETRWAGARVVALFEGSEAADSATVVRELGGGYARHHRYLRDALRARGRPRPEDFETFDAFIKAWAEVEAIVETEMLLRRCEAARKHGRSLDAPIDITVPVVDADDQLVPLPGYRIE